MIGKLLISSAESTGGKYQNQTKSRPLGSKDQNQKEVGNYRFSLPAITSPSQQIRIGRAPPGVSKAGWKCIIFFQLTFLQGEVYFVIGIIQGKMPVFQCNFFSEMNFRPVFLRFRFTWQFFSLFSCFIVKTACKKL